MEFVERVSTFGAPAFAFRIKISSNRLLLIYLVSSVMFEFFQQRKNALHEVAEIIEARACRSERENLVKQSELKNESRTARRDQECGLSKNRWAPGKTHFHHATK